MGIHESNRTARALRGMRPGLPFAAAVLIVAAAGAAQTSVKETLDMKNVLNRWIVCWGAWEVTADGLAKTEDENDGVVMFRLPVVRDAVRIAFEARADGPAGDLSLFLGMRDGHTGGAAFLGFGSGGGACNKIVVPGLPAVIVAATGDAPRVVQGRWHRIEIDRACGRLRLSVDGIAAVEAPDTPAGYPGPYVGLYAWNRATFRAFEAVMRPDAELAAFLDPEAFAREHAGHKVFEPWIAANDAVNTQGALRAALRAAGDAPHMLLAASSAIVAAQPHRFLGWPSLTRNADGEILAVFSGDKRHRVCPFGRIFLARSVEGARWSAPEGVVDTPLDDIEPAILSLASGSLLLSWFASDAFAALSTGSVGRLPLTPGDAARWQQAAAGLVRKGGELPGPRACLSKDGGQTWSPLPPPPAATPQGPIRRRDGSLAILGRGVHEGRQAIVAALSDDEGQSWTIVHADPLPPEETMRLHDACLVELPDGRLVGLLGYERFGWEALLWQIESPDGGETWSTPHITPVHGYAPGLVVLPDGRVLCCYGHSRSPWGQRACLSRDGGWTWDTANEIVLRDHAPAQSAGGPASLAMPDGTVVTLFAHASVEGAMPSLLATRWTPPPSPGIKERPDWPLPPPASYVSPADEPLDLERLRALRREAALRPRRIIMNNDGNDAGAPGATPEERAANFLARRTAPLAGSQVDAIFYCSGVFNLYDNPGVAGEVPFYGSSHVAAFAAAGCDSVAIVTQFGHDNGMEVFWSMRMNDTHDSFEPHWSHWKRTHPECLLGKRSDIIDASGQIAWRLAREHHLSASARWSSLDYEHPLVQDKVLAILTDVCSRYDIAGIELDFFRHPAYFRPQLYSRPVTDAQRDVMTDIVRRIRRMTEEVGARRGRPLLVAARVPDSIGYAAAIGLDVPRWLDEGLLDILVGGGFFRLEPWENLAALGRRHDIPVYACLSNFMRIENVADEWRGDALRAWEAGVDGIYTFNLFDPNSPLFREMGDPDVLRQRPHVYRYDPERTLAHPGQSAGTWLKGGETFQTAPIEP